jgi:hypothetical protein
MDLEEEESVNVINNKIKEENVVAVNNKVKLENPQLVDSTVVFTTDKVFAFEEDT